VTAKRRDLVLVAAVYLGVAFLMGRAHVANVDRPHAAEKLALHRDVIENRAPDPYEYKMWTVSWAVEGVHRATGARVERIYEANVYLSILALLLAHHLWISRLLSRPDGGRSSATAVAVLGTLFVAACAHALFLDYWHHPYDLWGVAGYCVLLAACASGARLPTLCLLALATGIVWEKQALAAPAWALWRWREGDGFLRTAARGAAFLAACLAVPVAIRVGLGGDRALVDVTPLSRQDWGRVVERHAPYVLPPLLVLGLAWSSIPRFVRCLWWTVPALFVLYLASRFFVQELRSFWAFAPVFSATICAWVRPPPAPAATP
jgi:hypothetical protein